MANNKLHHNKTLSNLNTEVKYANCERKWSRFGRNGENAGAKGFREIRKAYNKAHRKASKLQLSRYQAPQEEYVPIFKWGAEEDYGDDMDWTIGRDERRFNAEVNGCEAHLYQDQMWRDWNEEYDKSCKTRSDIV